MSRQNNVRRIKTVAAALDDLLDDVVFVGGSTISFYAQFEFEVRATDDVDIIVEAISYAEHAGFEERLRARGFVNDVQSHIRCRYTVNGISVDIMPTDDVAMGFKNIWYPDGFKQAINIDLEGTPIKILSPAYFLATKYEAFKNRGYSDPRQSQDFEDIVYVLETRESIWEELRTTNPKLKAYFKHEFSKLLDSRDVYEWIDVHVAFTSPPFTDRIVEELRNFIGRV
jgi:hypothetical protein